MGPLPYDIAIVGLGPVGAAAANLCGAAGLRTIVIEKAASPYGLPRAIHFDAEAMRIFQSVGLADEIAAITRPLQGSVYLGCDGHAIRTFRARDTRHSLGWPASNLFYQPRLEAILKAGAERFASVEVMTDLEQIGLTAWPDRVTLEVRDEAGLRQIEARYVLACDGASSPIRKRLGVSLDDMRFEERWLVIDAFVTGPMQWPDLYDIPAEVRAGDVSLMVCDPARPTTLIPGAGRHRRWEYMLMEDEADADVLRPEAIRALVGDWIDPQHFELARAAVYRFHGLVAREWRKDRVFLMGDAAHQTPPFFGQGMCHGLRDAAQLVWKLRMVLDGVADQTLLDTYQAEREGHVRSIITASVTAGAAVCIRDPDQAKDRDRRFRAEEAARHGVTVAMTDIVPPLLKGVIDGRTGGARFPQPPVMIAGRSVRLDDQLAGRFTLLTLEPPEADTMSDAAGSIWATVNGQTLHIGGDGRTGLQDPSSDLRTWFEVHDARWVVVRPDRYVFGTARTTAEVGDLIFQLNHQLQLIPNPRRQSEPRRLTMETNR